MNNDVVFEILLHLPVRSLLKFIGVHKSWYYIINSPHFRKLYTLRRNNNKYEEHNYPFNASVSVSGAVKGLVCISSSYALAVTICNPFLGQFKVLPLSPYASTHSRKQHFYDHHVRLGFDEDYIVVWLLSSCLEHRCLHANLYSARTNSWSELDIDRDLSICKPIKSVCKNGSFAHWEGQNTSGEKIILSFDMKNEVFRTITISRDHVLHKYFESNKDFVILAKGECSFVILLMDEYMLLKVYESSGEGSELIWNNVRNVDLYSFWKCDFLWSSNIPFWRNDNCVVLKDHRSGEVLLYDYRARKFIRHFKMHGSSASEKDIIEYEGSLISP